jgi:hypothetical protein
VYDGWNFFVGGQDGTPRDLFFDGTHFWIPGWETDRVYRYNDDGVYDDYFFPVNEGFPSGITSNRTYIWVVGWSNAEVQRYAQNTPAQSPYLDICADGDTEWSFPGDFTTKLTTPDFSAEINEFLSTANPDESGWCSVPIVLHSESPGVIEISGIEITYDYNTSYLYDISYVSDEIGYSVNGTTGKVSVDFSSFGFYVDNYATSAKVDGI